MLRKLNKEFLKDVIEILADTIEEVGYRNPTEIMLPSGVEIKIYNQYPHIYRIEVKDRYKRDLAPLFFDDHPENLKGGEDAVQEK